MQVRVRHSLSARRHSRLEPRRLTPCSVRTSFCHIVKAFACFAVCVARSIVNHRFPPLYDLSFAVAFRDHCREASPCARRRSDPYFLIMPC
jgi:hypothetical protein